MESNDIKKGFAVTQPNENITQISLLLERMFQQHKGAEKNAKEIFRLFNISKSDPFP